MVEFGPPFPADSAPPTRVTTPVAAAPPVVVEYVQPDPVIEYAVPASSVTATPVPAVEHDAPAPAVTYTTMLESSSKLRQLTMMNHSSRCNE